MSCCRGDILAVGSIRWIDRLSLMRIIYSLLGLDCEGVLRGCVCFMATGQPPFFVCVEEGKGRE